MDLSLIQTLRYSALTVGHFCARPCRRTNGSDHEDDDSHQEEQDIRGPKERKTSYIHWSLKVSYGRPTLPPVPTCTEMGWTSGVAFQKPLLKDKNSQPGKWDRKGQPGRRSGQKTAECGARSSSGHLRRFRGVRGIVVWRREWLELRPARLAKVHLFSILS